MLNCISDAQISLYSSKKQFHWIDIDAFGSPISLLDSALQAIASGGILAVTATDCGTLQGKIPTECFKMYGCVTKPGLVYRHEMSVRILLASIYKIAASHQLRIEVQLAFVVDYFVRVFVRVFDNTKIDWM